MTNFIQDNTSPGAVKSDFVSRPEVPATKKVAAVDWNTFRQALLDTQSHLRGAPWASFAPQASDPAPSGLTDYIWLEDDGTLHVVFDGDDSVVGALPDTAVTPGTYDLGSVTVDAKGRLTSAVPGYYVSVKTAGAEGDDTTDDRADIITAVASAKALGARLHFPFATYLISKYIPVEDARGLYITSDGATIHYPSDDLAVTPDATATTDQQARSAFFLKNCTDVSVEGLVFQGGDSSNINTDNVGVGISQMRCVGTRIRNCVAFNGYSLHAQDDQIVTTGTGDSIAVASGIVTLTDSAATFRAGHAKRFIEITGPLTNKANKGVFQITEFVSSTVIKYANPRAIAETSSFRWEIDDNDRNTIIDSCRLDGCRGVMTVPSHSKVLRTAFRHPMTNDLAGIPTSFVLDGTTITMSAVKGTWDESVINTYVYVLNSTTPGNNGLFLITGATKRTRFTPATLTYTNASGATELGSATGTWWIAGGERVGIGAGASSIAYSAGVVTFTASQASFHASDVDKVFRVGVATNAGNNGAFVIASVVSSTVITFANTSGVNENFVGIWSLDSYDAANVGGGARGASHFIYIFAGSDVVRGREDIEIAGCIFVGCRKNAVKISGSATCIRNIHVHHNTAVECASFGTFGADDSTDHSGMNLDHNTIVDCGTGRPGWSDSIAMTYLGSNGSSADTNAFHYTRPTISAVDGRNTVAGHYGIQASRYLAGISQPLTNFSASFNKFTIDYQSTRPGLGLAGAVQVQDCGIIARYRTGGTLTRLVNTMTLTDTSAVFSQDLVGASIRLYGAPDAANNITATVLTVTSANTLTFLNALGVGVGAAAGTYRIQPLASQRGSTCRLNGNTCDGAAATAIIASYNVAPEIVGTVWNNCTGVVTLGNLVPRFTDGRQVGRVGSNAGIVLSSSDSWPIVGRNTITVNGNVLNAGQIRGDVGVGIDNSTKVDHPLLGMSGRIRPTDAKAEMVFAVGALHVNGDSFVLNGSPIVYDTTVADGVAGKWSTQTGLIACLTAVGGVDAEDYGSTLGSPTTTGHIRVHLAAAASTASHIYMETFDILNPNALVFPRNDTDSGEVMIYSRGEGTVGDVPARAVVWSPLCTFSGTPLLMANNVTAAATIAGGVYLEKDTKNAGCCDVLRFTLGTNAADEYRWGLAS